MLDALPPQRQLAAARRLPGLRPQYARRLTAEVSLSNGAFALASGVPSLVPILGVPITAADTVVLTKNQALMVYRLALAFGAPPEFQRRMMEITPVIGAAVVWRQVAGGLVGLVPGYGILPKTAVAFAGTYITGRAAELWYATGLVSKDDLRRISAEATAKARSMAGEQARRAREARDAAGRARRATTRVRDERPAADPPAWAASPAGRHAVRPAAPPAFPDAPPAPPGEGPVAADSGAGANEPRRDHSGLSRPRRA